MGVVCVCVCVRVSFFFIAGEGGFEALGYFVFFLALGFWGLLHTNALKDGVWGRRF